jgi:hypothetical protein
MDQIHFDYQTSHHQSISLPVPHLSQLTLPHKRCLSMCSPTATTSTLRYLLKNQELDPLIVAEGVRDHGFDIFGNWVFNTAYAYTLTHHHLHTWVERISTFNRVHELLSKGYPLVISIKPNKDSTDGHLIGLIGYDAKTKEVLCMDPAKEIHPIKYSLESLAKHWGYRDYIAYIFSPIN